MAATQARVFTEEELRQAGRLTIDIIREKLQEGSAEEALRYVNRFRQELMTMFFSYRGWEDGILDFLESRAGPEGRQQALQSIENPEIAPERVLSSKGVAKQWESTLQDAEKYIAGGEVEQALQQLDPLYHKALQLHDGFMSRVTALLTLVYEGYGDQALMAVLQTVMNPDAMAGGDTGSYREKVESVMMFARCHLQAFCVIEDDDKVTFIPDPCPSGGRLVREGHYRAPRSNAMVRDAGPLTYGRPELPVYCCHEPAMELASLLKTGVPVFIVEPPAQIGLSPCNIHIYKNLEDIPEAYYQRMGVSRDPDLIARSGRGTK